LSYFNDTYVLRTQGGDPITIIEDGIAWKTDKEKFKRAANSESI